MADFPRVVVFGLDDTLAPSKASIDRRMADLFVRLLGRTEVCVISGGHFGQFEAQVPHHLAGPPRTCVGLRRFKKADLVLSCLSAAT